MSTDTSDVDKGWNGSYTLVGREDGYDRWKLTGVHGVFRIRIFYTDDRGRTWSGGEPIDMTPMVWAVPSGRFIEQDDGTVVMPAYGCLSEKDTDGRLDRCGLYRSTDSGKSWRDFSLIACDERHKEIAYNEVSVEPMTDGIWTAILRSDVRVYAGGHISLGSIAFSTDQGRTWSRPELTFPGSTFDLALLPDGGLAKLVFSYDGGHTWSREVQSYTDTYTRFALLPNGNLFTYSGWGGKAGSVYRRIPASTE